MVSPTRVHELEQQLRDAVNMPEIQYRLMQNPRRWQQLCSSMDVIGDTNTAIAAYLASPPMQDLGHLYLLAYGLLQVLFVQQYAIKHAAEAVELSYEFPKDLLDVREIRNSAIGHPTKRGDKNSKSFGIVQASLSNEDFTLYAFDWDRPDAFQPIRFQDLIEVQSNVVIQAIEQILHHLQTMQ